MNTQDVRLNIVLHEKQQAIESDPATKKVIKAGKRFGKTKWALYALLKRGLKKPGGVFWYTAPTYRQAKSIAWYEMKWMLPRQYVKRYVETELMIETVNDVRFELKGEENEDTLRGIGIDGLCRDECALNPRGEYAGNLLEGQMIGRSGFVYHISSPNPKGRNWFTNLYEQAESKMKAGDKNWLARHHTIYDNPTLPPHEIEDLRSRTSDDMWNLEYMAEESALGGVLYSEFDYGLHVGNLDGDEFDLCIIGMDYGLDHPNANVWVKVNTQKKLIYVSDEYGKSGDRIDEICKAVRIKCGSAVPDYGVIDPSAIRRSWRDKRTVVDDYRMEFKKFGGAWEYFGIRLGDNKDRGREILKMYLKRGIVKVNPKCRNLISQLRSVMYGDDVNDDFTDALRYACLDIHDRINGMREVVAAMPELPKGPRPYNMNDPLLFPDRSNESSNWALDQIYATR